MILESKINRKGEKCFSQLLDFLNWNGKNVLLTLLLLTVVLRMAFVFLTYSKTGVSRWSDDFYYIDATEQIAKGN